jgi:hypothetical protein
MDEYLRLAYQSALEDIRFFKKQQWMVTNYTILIYGSMIAVSKLTKSIGNEWLTCIAGAIGVLSFLLIIQLHCSTEKARNRINEVKKAVGEQEKDRKDLVTILFGKETDACGRFFDKYSVLALLDAVVIGGGILTVWVIWVLKYQS